MAQLLHQTKAPPVTVISHSLGAVVALYYAGIYPHSVSRLIAIEGLAPPPQMRKEAQRPIEARLRSWVDDLRALSGRMPRRYVSIEEAFHRMQQENPNLSPEQAHHLTVHGINQNEDGTYSWKFDNYVRPAPPLALRGKDTVRLWGRIACPTLLVRGSESWATDPNQDGRIAHFHHAEAVSIEGAGHWVHHDRLDAFVARVREFLSRPRRDEYGGES